MSGACTVRPAAVGDLLACAAIINDYIDATEWLPRTITREQIEAAFAPDALTRRRIWVADCGGTIEGYASLDPAENFLHALYLRPQIQRRGVGKALLNEVKAACPAGFTLKAWEPNADAMRFYKREGLVEVPEGLDTATEEGVPTHLFRWEGQA